MDETSPAFLKRRDFFLKETQRRAESLLSYIDRRVNPVVFLADIQGGDDESLRAEVFTAKDSWISNVDFSDFPKYLTKHAAESRIMKRRISKGELGSVDISFGRIREALVKVLKNSPTNPGDMKFFISQPAPFGDVSVCVCIAIEEDILDKYPSIDSVVADTDFYLSSSLMGSVIDEFLEKHRIEINLPFGDSGYESFNFGLESILQQAGRDFVGDIAYRVLKRPQPEWLDHIYTVCSEIARSGYELEDASGTILLAPQNSEYITHTVRFAGHLKLADVRSTRKLLELTKDGMVLHCDSETVFGLCKPPRRIPKSAACFSIDFLRWNKWQASHMGRPLIVVSSGTPRLARSSFEAREFAEALNKVFCIKSPRKTERLVELIQIAAKERKGTILVFSKKARDEAKRLSPQSTAIAPTQMTKYILGSLTPIDGAILIDPKGICHSIGTILDGVVSLSGDSSRGARYNSAVKYIESRKLVGEVCMAIAVSEDGKIDIIT